MVLLPLGAPILTHQHLSSAQVVAHRATAFPEAVLQHRLGSPITAVQAHKEHALVPTVSSAKRKVSIFLQHILLQDALVFLSKPDCHAAAR